MAPLLTRPVAELFGAHVGYGFAGDGVNTAIGNYTKTMTDLRFPVALLVWGRTYNSRDVTGRLLGVGWTASLSAYLAGREDGVMEFHDDDGRVLAFVPDSDGYRRPADLDADLSRAGDGFLLQFRTGQTWTVAASGRVTDRAGQGTRLGLEYDLDGRLKSAVHSAGHRLALSYDASGRLVAVEASDGRVVSYDYTDAGLLTSVAGPDGGVSRYQPTPGGLLERAVDPTGREVVATTYDDTGLVARQDIGGRAFAFEYGDDGVTTVTRMAGGERTVYRHGASGRLVAVVDPGGRIRRQSFDAGGRLVEVERPDGRRLSQTYDAHGNILSQTDGDRVTTYAYDDQHRIISRTDPTGAAVRHAYTGVERLPSRIVDPTGVTTSLTVADGLVREVIEAEGAKTTFEYDSGRRLVAVTDPAGGTTRHEYDAVGRHAAVITPLGGTTRYAYDAAGRLVETVDPTGGITRHTYTATGMLLRSTDAAGAVKQQEYDEQERLVARVDEVGGTTRYEYDAAGRLVNATNATGGVYAYAYDDLDRLASATGPTGQVTTYAYDSEGQRTAVGGPDGGETTRYDARGNVVEVIDTAGHTTRYEYDDADRMTARIDASGALWRTAYDAAGRVISRTDPTGALSRYEYDRVGRVTASYDPLGNMTSFRYDDAGRLVELGKPGGGILRYAYDADGRKISETTATGQVTRYEYDPAGRLVGEIDARGSVTRYEYSDRGQLTARTGPSGAIRRWEYDDAGRLVSCSDANGHATRYGYDATHGLTSITDANGGVTRYTRDPAGRVTATTDPLGRTTTFQYDGDRLTAVTDPAGAVVRMEYDPVGNLVRRLAGDAAEVSFRYDALGRRTLMTDEIGTTRYGYDPAGRLLTLVGPDASVLSWTYDAAGRRTALQYPDGLRVDYRYDPNDRLIWMRDPLAGEVEYTLDAAGRLLYERLPDGWTREYRYDVAGLLTQYAERRGPTAQVDAAITRDADGRITVVQEQGREQRFEYDPAGQVLSATEQLDGTMRSTYDPVGNRTGIAGSRMATTLSYDAADQVMTADKGRDRDHNDHDDHATTDADDRGGTERVTYRHDELGRLVERVGPDGRVVITYDAFGLPVKTEHSGLGRDDTVTRTVEAAYNGDGLLVRLVLTDFERQRPARRRVLRYRWNLAEPTPQILTQRVEVEEPRHKDGDLLAIFGNREPDERDADFVYGYSRLFAHSAGDSATFSRDAFGSTIRTADTAAWAQASRYDIFGRPDGGPTVSPRFGYRGELAFDETVYLRARTYDPTIGQFRTRDPVVTRVGGEDVASPYTYANNDPVNFIDPQGTWSIPDVLGGLGELIGQMVPIMGDGVGEAIGVALGAGVAGLEEAPTQGFGPAEESGFGRAPCSALFPIPAPPTCSDETPEYCHAPGANRLGPYELGLQWVRAEAHGCGLGTVRPVLPHPGPNGSCYDIEYFRDGDLLTTMIQRLPHVRAARGIIRSRIGKCEFEGGVPFHYAKQSVLHRVGTAIDNLYSILSNGLVGMPLAQAFLGSYELNWKVVAIDRDARWVVEFNLTNASTMSSANLDPGKIFFYKEGNAGDGHDAGPLEHWTKQSVRWRESLEVAARGEV